MPVLAMYNDFREKFPEITEKADKEHIRLWDEIDPEFAYSWFESLANVLNKEMAKEIPVIVYKPIFEFIRRKYLSGDDEVRNCIDVAFVENLFWQLPSQKAEPYWDSLPQVLKDLYIAFHKSTPA